MRIITLFRHITAAEQDRRLVDRPEPRWTRWKLSSEDFRNRSRRAADVEAHEEMLARPSSPSAPWHVVAADHKRWARLDGLGHVVARLPEGIGLFGEPRVGMAFRRCCVHL